MTNRAPPLAPYVTVLAPFESRDPVESSAQTKEPSWAAFAPRPAAKLYSPLAVFELPPATEEAYPRALLLKPPITVA